MESPTNPVRFRYNHRRLHGEIGHVPPTEHETTHWANTMINNYPDNRVLTEAGTN